MPKRASWTTAQDRLIRQYQILAALSHAKLGLTAAELQAETESSRSTVHRGLQVLRAAGFPIDCSAGRYHLRNTRELPPLGFSALQIASLKLARAQLAPVGGTLLLQEFDRLLTSLEPPKSPRKGDQTAFRFAEPRKPALAPRVLRVIEKALASKKRACIEYRAASRGGTTALLHIEPLLVSVAESDPYVRAYCVERQGERTYKLSRITGAELTRERATYRRSAADPFAHAVKAWSGAPVSIALKLDAPVAWLAREYPLPGQTERPNPDGSVTITATVAGLIEAQRRILAWGGAAEVLEPPELRAAVRKELATALSKYDGPGPTKARKEKSTGADRRDLKQGEKRVG